MEQEKPIEHFTLGGTFHDFILRLDHLQASDETSTDSPPIDLLCGVSVDAIKDVVGRVSVLCHSPLVSLPSLHHFLFSQLGFPPETDVHSHPPLLLQQDFSALALCYSGYRFNNPCGKLGDGRVVSIGEFFFAAKHNSSSLLHPHSFPSKMIVQIKGIGKTKYSRNCDGRCTLWEAIKEFLTSEFLAYLAIPSSLPLFVLVSLNSDVRIKRKVPFSPATHEKVSFLARMAPCWLRISSFEWAFEASDGSNFFVLQKLVSFVIDNYFHSSPDSPLFDRFSHLQHFVSKAEDLQQLVFLSDEEIKMWTKEHQQQKKQQKFVWFLLQVIKRTAKLISLWMGIGFVHGMITTDNMSPLGFTLDFGTCKFMSSFNPDFVCHHSKRSSFYSFKNQPQAGAIIVKRMAISLSGVIKSKVFLNQCLQWYWPLYYYYYYKVMIQKLGLSKIQKLETEDLQLIEDLLDVLSTSSVDYTKFFWKLSRFCEFSRCNDDKQGAVASWLEQQFENDSKTDWHKWFQLYKTRLNADEHRTGKKVNAKYLPQEEKIKQIVGLFEEGKTTDALSMLEDTRTSISHCFGAKTTTQT